MQVNIELNQSVVHSFIKNITREGLRSNNILVHPNVK